MTTLCREKRKSPFSQVKTKNAATENINRINLYIKYPIPELKQHNYNTGRIATREDKYRNINIKT